MDIITFGLIPSQFDYLSNILWKQIQPASQRHHLPMQKSHTQHRVLFSPLLFQIQSNLFKTVTSKRPQGNILVSSNIQFLQLSYQISKLCSKDPNIPRVSFLLFSETILQMWMSQFGSIF